MSTLLDFINAGGLNAKDRALLRDVERAGGRVYRTHGAEYLVVRHGLGHAWTLPDAAFLARAQTGVAGFQPALADIDVQRRAPPSTISLFE